MPMRGRARRRPGRAPRTGSCRRSGWRSRPPSASSAAATCRPRSPATPTRSGSCAGAPRRGSTVAIAASSRPTSVMRDSTPKRNSSSCRSSMSGGAMRGGGQPDVRASAQRAHTQRADRRRTRRASTGARCSSGSANTSAADPALGQRRAAPGPRGRRVVGHRRAARGRRRAEESRRGCRPRARPVDAIRPPCGTGGWPSPSTSRPEASRSRNAGLVPLGKAWVMVAGTSVQSSARLHTGTSRSPEASSSPRVTSALVSARRTRVSATSGSPTHAGRPASGACRRAARAARESCDSAMTGVSSSRASTLRPG